MSVNESKADQSNTTSWAKWRKSGAVGGMFEAETLPIKKVAKPIVATGTHYNPDGTAKGQTLSIGEKLVAKGDGWETTKPEVYVVVPGDPLNVGKKIRAKDLPPGTQTMAQAFGK